MMVWKCERIHTITAYVQKVFLGMHFQSTKRNMTIESGKSPYGDHDAIKFA